MGSLRAYISPVLANITLDGLEQGLMEFLRTKLGTNAARRAKVNLVRYADDFVVTGSSKELLETTVKPWVVEFLRERGLSLSEEKTSVVHIEHGFDFLGWNFRKYSEKLLIKPSRQNVKAFYAKVREIIGSSLSITKYELIRRLNPALRGWAQYHKGVVAKEAFNRMDSQIFWRLMRWGQRRHPRKSRKWVLAHYWKHLKNGYKFGAQLRTESDEVFSKELYVLASTKIERHIKVKGDFNPFDPNWIAYGERLQVERMSKDIWDSQRLELWIQQLVVRFINTITK